MNKKIWLSSPHIGNNEFKNVTKAFETNWIAPLGPFVDEFENKISEYTNRNVAALNSGTSALHLALILLDVKKDDIVLCQSFTFSATTNPIIYQSATPVFIDSEIDTWNMCPNALEYAIIKYIKLGKHPKAIIPVHLYGMPAKMKEIMSLSEKYGIPIIEDAAEALGSKYFNIPCGTFGEMAVLSFNGNKIITTSGGGALLSNNVNLINKAKFLATQARDPAPHYQHTHIGYNYRLSNVLAAIGVGQLDVLNERVLARRSNFDYYKKGLNNKEGIIFLDEKEGFYSNRWLTCITVNSKQNKYNREDIRLLLENDNIESRPLWKPMHLQPIFNKYDYIGGDVAENLFENGLCLPSGSNLITEDLDRVIEIINKD
jgi:dTDP-4-amino-4,6-dideoxygalactose transaminase